MGFNVAPRKRKIAMSAFALKMIAAATMVIDHVGAMFFPQIAVFRVVGRVAFPIYAFLAAEGAAKTRNPSRYLARLAVFALISELPFRMALSVGWDKYTPQNVLFTLLAGVACCVVCSSQKPIPSALFTVFAAAAAELCGTDYGAYGVLCVAGFYLLRGKTAEQGMAFSLLTALRVILTAPIQGCAVLGFLPCACYSGQRGRDLRGLFYAIYPAHLLLLWAIRQLV